MPVVAGDRTGALCGREEAGELQRPVAEPRRSTSRRRRHKATFLTQYKSDPAAEPFTALPRALRLGDTKPDWRTPAAADLDRRLEGHAGPGRLGNARACRTSTASSGSRGRSTSRRARRRRRSRSAGSSNIAEVWVNGLSVSLGAERRASRRGGAAGGGRGGPPRLPAAGRRDAPGHEHGHRAHPEQPERRRLPGHAGDDVRRHRSGAHAAGGHWRYRVERQTNAGALYAKPGELAAHVAFTAEGGLAGAAGAALPKIAAAGARRRAPPGGRPRPDAVRHDGADRRARADSSRSCSSILTACSTTSCSARRDRSTPSARPPTSSRARRTAWRSSTFRTLRRCCSRPSCSSQVRP